MARYLLDTGLLIQHLRGKRRAVQLMRNLGKSNQLAISTVTRLEIHAGMRPEQEYATQKLLSRFASLDLDRNIAERAGKLVQILSQQNKSIGMADTIIAATALQHNITLVTLNKKHFERVSGLRLYPIDEELL